MGGAIPNPGHVATRRCTKAAGSAGQGSNACARRRGGCEAAAGGASLVVFPEALIPGYPVWDPSDAGV